MHWFDRFFLPYNWMWLNRWRERKKYPLVSVWPEVENPEFNRLDRQRIITHMEASNPARWRRFVKDFRHYQRVMHKLGRNPEDVRFLLP